MVGGSPDPALDFLERRAAVSKEEEMRGWDWEKLRAWEVRPWEGSLTYSTIPNESC